MQIRKSPVRPGSHTGTFTRIPWRSLACSIDIYLSIRFNGREKGGSIMAAKDLRQLGPSTWVMEGPTNIGFINTEEGVFLVDSGNGKEAGRQINKMLKKMEWTLCGVINTHSNADHIGGNDYLQRNLSCKIYAPAVEAAFTEHPELETAFLWGGKPVKDLENRFFKAVPSRVDHILTEKSQVAEGLTLHVLDGHFFNMMGIETCDQVLFLADALFGCKVLEKYRLPFIYDVGAFKASIARIQALPANWYVPSHGSIRSDIQELAQANLSVVENLETDILEIVTRAAHYDHILKAVCDRYGITLDYGQYALVGSTIRSFLSYLYNEEKLTYYFEDNLLYWKS